MRALTRARLSAALLVLIAWALCPADARGQRLELSITPSSFSFPSADPDLAPVVSSPTLTIRYRVQQNQGAQWRITVLANGDLQSGSTSIPITNVTWMATPSPPFQNGTLSSTVEQLLASGTGNSNPARTGTITFTLVNSWNYAAGVYSQSFVFTISAP
jgi:hypothetical protein